MAGKTIATHIQSGFCSTLRVPHGFGCVEKRGLENISEQVRLNNYGQISPIKSSINKLKGAVCFPDPFCHHPRNPIFAKLKN